MASNTVYDAIKAHVQASWATTPIAFENEAFTRPSPPAPWIALEVSGTVYAQQTIGAGSGQANRWDEEGYLYIYVMVPTGTGSSDARAYAKSLANIFRGTTLLSDNLEFMDASIGDGSIADEEGTYWRLIVSIDWRFMEA